MNKKLLIPFAVLSTTTVLSVAFLSRVPDLKQVDVQADYSVTLDNNDLKQAALSTLVVPDNRFNGLVYKEDRQFRIPLPNTNGKYVSGAVIFGDCGDQYVGASLGDPFGIDIDTGNNPAFNFHFVFSFQYIKSLSVTFTARIITESKDTTAQRLWIRPKAKAFQPYFASEEVFYDTITDKDNGGYDKLLQEAKYEGGYYDYVCPAPWVSNQNAFDAGVDQIDKTVATPDFTTGEYQPYQLAVYQIRNAANDPIGDNRNLQVSIKSITFNYKC